MIELLRFALAVLASLFKSKLQPEAKSKFHLRPPSLSVPLFHETKERSDKTLWAHLNRAADVIVYECSGLMFWFTQKKFVGSYLAFKATRRS